MNPEPALQPAPDGPGSTLDRSLLQALLLTGLCVVCFFVSLDAVPMRFTEGHRAIVGWEMLDRFERTDDPGGFMRSTLFGATYIRKPPGMPWLAALSASVFGTEIWSARLVGAIAATLGVFTTWWFARRWFGSRPGFYAACAHALLPVLWPGAMSAEIESLHNLGVQLACFTLIHTAITNTRPRPTPSEHVWLTLSLSLGVIIAGLSKGPAGAPTLVATLAACVYVARSARRLIHPRVLVGGGYALAFLGYVGYRFLRANDDPDAIREDVAGFLWSLDKLAGVALLPILAFVSALPATFALLFPFGPDARKEAQKSDRVAAQTRLARALALSWLGAVGVSMLLGMDNPRYLLPAHALAAACTGYVFAGAFVDRWMQTKRVTIARVMTLGTPMVLAACLLIAVGVMHTMRFAWKPTPPAEDPRALGARIAQLANPQDRFPSLSDIWADGLVEARPDVLWYATDSFILAHRRHLVWKKDAVQRGELPPARGFLVLRLPTTREPSDAPAEIDLYKEHIDAGRLREVFRGQVHIYPFKVFVVEDAQADDRANTPRSDDENGFSDSSSDSSG